MSVVDWISLTVSVIALLGSFMVPFGVSIAYFIKNIKKCHYESCCGCLNIDNTLRSNNDLKKVVTHK